MANSRRKAHHGSEKDRPLRHDWFWLAPVELAGRDASLLEIDLNESWRARVIVMPMNGQPQTVGLAITHSSAQLPEGGFPLRLLRRVTESEIRAIYEVRVETAREPVELRKAPSTDLKPMRPRRRGRRPIPLTELARLARSYLDGVESGQPVEKIAAAEFISVDHFRDLLTRARREGILTKPPRGRAGGVLTALGERLLGDG